MIIHLLQHLCFESQSLPRDLRGQREVAISVAGRLQALKRFTHLRLRSDFPGENSENPGFIPSNYGGSGRFLHYPSLEIWGSMVGLV